MSFHTARVISCNDLHSKLAKPEMRILIRRLKKAPGERPITPGAPGVLLGVEVARPPSYPSNVTFSLSQLKKEAR